MKTRVNLATAPLESNRRFAIGAASVGVLGVAAMFLLAGRAFSIWRADRAGSITSASTLLPTLFQTRRTPQALIRRRSATNSANSVRSGYGSGFDRCRRTGLVL